MTDKSLKNKKIIISAGASGIGLAIVKICLSRGAIVFVNDLSQKYINKLNYDNLVIGIYLPNSLEYLIELSIIF